MVLTVHTHTYICKLHKIYISKKNILRMSKTSPAVSHTLQIWWAGQKAPKNNPFYKSDAAVIFNFWEYIISIGMFNQITSLKYQKILHAQTGKLFPMNISSTILQVWPQSFQPRHMHSTNLSHSRNPFRYPSQPSPSQPSPAHPIPVQSMSKHVCLGKSYLRAILQRVTYTSTTLLQW